MRRDEDQSDLDRWDPTTSALAANVRAGILTACESGDSARFEKEVLKTFRSLLLPTKLPGINCDVGSYNNSFINEVDDLRRWMDGNGPCPEWVPKHPCDTYVPWPKDSACMTHVSDAIVLALTGGFMSGWGWVARTLSDAMVTDDISCGFGPRGMLTVFLLVYILWPNCAESADRCSDVHMTAVNANRSRHTAWVDIEWKWNYALKGSTSWRMYSVEWAGYLRWAANAIADRWLEQMWSPDTEVGRRMVRSLKRRFENANGNEDSRSQPY